MRKIFTVIFFSIGFVILLVACQGEIDQKNELDVKASQQNLSSLLNGVSIKMEKESYPTSTKSLILKVENNGESQFDSPSFFLLEKKIDEIWYEFPDKIEAHYANGLDLRPGETSTLEIFIKDLKYNLTPGEYRAVLNGMAAPFEVKK